VSGELLQATATSLQSLALGFGAAIVIGVPLGLVMGVARGFGRVARVYIDLLIALPTAALIPLVILSFGISIASSAVIVFVFSAPFITMNAYGGVRDTRPRLVEMARSYGASRLQLFARVVLPSALPMILAGMRLGLSRAFLGLIVAELLLSPFGLGRLIMNSRSMFEHDKMFATVAWTLILSGVALALLSKLEGRLLRWRA
jgi:NitT/TauT family transport system permease protein